MLRAPASREAGATSWLGFALLEFFWALYDEDGRIFPGGKSFRCGFGTFSDLLFSLNPLLFFPSVFLRRDLIVDYEDFPPVMFFPPFLRRLLGFACVDTLSAKHILFSERRALPMLTPCLRFYTPTLALRPSFPHLAGGGTFLFLFIKA